MNNIVKEIDGILDGMVVVVKKLIKKTRLNYTEIGTIINKNDNGTYKVKVNNSITDIKSLHGIEYKENDVVYILTMNQDLSKRVILDSVCNSTNLEEKIKKDTMKEVEKMIDEKIKILVEQLNTVNEVKEA